MFYGSGDCLVLNIPTSDSDDIPEIVRRLEEISIGCQVREQSALSFCQIWPARPVSLQGKWNSLKEHLHDDPSHSCRGVYNVYHPRSALI